MSDQPSTPESASPDVPTRVGAPTSFKPVRPGDTVDAVITWVDGAEESHRAKRERILSGGEAVERVARIARRFSDNDEIRFCIRAIRNHAPWIRKIWLITDSQQPRSLDLALATEAGVEVVDHRVIFRGLEALLPSFNSMSIETLMWRIPGLADRFIYFNDDVFLTDHVKLVDYFNEGRPILRGKWQPWSDAPEKLLPHQARKNGAALCGQRGKPYFIAAHVCHPMLTEVMEETFHDKLPDFARNAAYRFRDREQFFPIAVHNHIALGSGRAVTYDRPENDWLFFTVKFCTHGTPSQIISKLEHMAHHKVSMACLNYLESVIEKVPNALDYLDKATGPAAAFERARIASTSTY